MPDAAARTGGEFPDVARGDGGGDGRAIFVVEKIQRLSSGPDGAELLVVGGLAAGGRAAVERGPHHRVAAIPGYDGFGLHFRLAINAERVDRVRLDVVSFAAVKDQVCREENKIRLCR